MRALLLVLAVFAPTAYAEPKIDYPTVAAALKDLEAKDGAGTVVTHAEGWTVVNEPPITQWSFTPAGHEAHPAVVRRIIRRGADGKVTVEIATLCEAKKDACTKLEEEFATLNERIVQQARARGGPVPPRPPQ